MSHSPSASERLQQLEQLVPLCEAIRKGTEYGTALERATREVATVSGLPERLDRLEPALRALKETTHLPADDLILDLGRLQAAGHRLEQCVSTEALKDARFSVRDLQETLQRVEMLVSKAWAARVQAEFVPLQRLGTVLAGIPDTSTAGAALETWATRTLGVSATGTPTSQAVQQFAEAQGELAARLGVLGKLGIDADVRIFLLNIVGGKATLESMTPGVLAWLQAKNALARFRIDLT